VLIMEVVVTVLAVPVAVHIDRLPARSALIAAGVAVAAAIVFAALAKPLPRALVVGGSLLQVYLIVTGIIVPVMYFLGAIFAAFWVLGFWLNRRAEQRTQP
jgi:hypothetical protein